jgi:polyribonucleotide 5'-hydroxyl-kinase
MSLNSGAFNNRKEWIVPAECEYRAHLDWSERLSIKLIAGTAEIFGAEIAPDTQYDFFEGSNIAVYTWEGCKLEVVGGCKDESIGRETPMNSILNVHMSLESARSSGQEGPRVFIYLDPLYLIS